MMHRYMGLRRPFLALPVKVGRVNRIRATDVEGASPINARKKKEPKPEPAEPSPPPKEEKEDVLPPVVISEAPPAPEPTPPPPAPTPAPVPAPAKLPKKKVLVVGAGWAGFGSAYHLSKEGYEVTLVDASPNPGGLSSGWVTKDAKKVEAGVKGFWYEYYNIFQLIKELDLPEWPLTAWTRSAIFNPRGFVTESPIFQDQFKLPTLLGQFVHTLPLFRDLSLADRVTMFPLLLSLFDYKSSEAQYQKYDQMTARELFRFFNISERLYEEFLKPICLVGLFAPPEDLSAAVLLDTYYYYALAHQESFDVCWCKGNVAERILEPLVQKIEGLGGKVLGSHIVTDVKVDPSSGEIKGLLCKDLANNKPVDFDADAVIFAVGVTGMQKLVQASKVLSSKEEFRNVMNLKGLDVISTRLWFDKRVDTKFPSNVITGWEPDTGGTFFNLNVLHDEYKSSPGSVIAADFYHSNTLMPLSDEEVAAKVHNILKSCEPGFRSAKLTDYAVLKFPKAVTHFSAGSYKYRPNQDTSFSNVFIAGDWIKGLDHGANGLSQERAYITGLAAANLAIRKLGQGSPARIIPVSPDEPHIAIPQRIGKEVRGALEAAGVRSPFLL